MVSAHKQQLLADQRRRNEVEGVFGAGKRKYSLKLIMARLTACADGSVSMSFLVMCTEQILRLLRLFFVLLLVWLFGPTRLDATIAPVDRVTYARWDDLLVSG